jgi:plastocyanin
MVMLALLVFVGCGSSDDENAGAPAPASSTSSGASSGASAASALRIVSFKYRPATLEVEPGATIRVRNEDDAAHTVTAEDDAFDSGSVKAGASGQFKAPGEAGAYAYICAFHPFMRGKLVVR